MSEDLRGLVSFMARTVVDDPDAVSLVERDEGHRLVYVLRVSAAEKGKIIGRGGRTARAMRVLLGAAAAKRGQRAELEIAE